MRCIDADALDCLAWKDGEHGTTFDDGVLWVLSKIDEQPTIEPERKKGTWIYLDKDKRFFHPHIVKCSVCNNSLDMYGVNAGRGDANFCPNCGARMEGET